MLRLRKIHAVGAAIALALFGAAGAGTAMAVGGHPSVGLDGPFDTATPIQHLVVIFDENVSFDHYFGTYPYAGNQPGETPFVARPFTPTVNGLYASASGGVPTGPLLTANPNGSNPVRLGPGDPMTCDQDHNYTHEQNAADHGAMDAFPASVGHNLTVAQCLSPFTVGGQPEPVPAGGGGNSAVLSYYDGNTVTAMWNYAQHFAMSDNAWTTTFGPSTPGALNLVAGNNYGVICGDGGTINAPAPCAAPPGFNTTNPELANITTSASGPTSVADQPAAGTGTVLGDPDPTFDICTYLPGADGGDGRSAASTMTMGGNNIGEELSTAGITWGWFQGGFDDGYVPGQGTTPPTTAQICSQSHQNVGGSAVTDYNPHHEPFQYYASTANPMHLPPTSVAMIGHNDQANHQYDIADFWAAADSGNMPAVSFLKAPNYQDGHAGYSDPTDEQNWLTSTINHLASLPSWGSTAVVITYDDSDGWYDHVMGPVLTASQASVDSLTAVGQCGSAANVPVNSANQPEQGRCGVGNRVPFLVISPWAKRDYVSSQLIDQTSAVKFIESNWGLSALGNGSADTAAGSIDSMFLFGDFQNSPLFLGRAGRPETRAAALASQRR